MGFILNFLIWISEKFYPINKFYNDYFNTLGRIGFILQTFFILLLCGISLKLSNQISLYFIIPTILAYIIILLFFVGNLKSTSYYISQPIIEFLFCVVNILVLVIILIFYYDIPWIIMTILWIFFPVFVLILFGYLMGGP